MPLAQYQAAVDSWFNTSQETSIAAPLDSLLEVRNLTYSYDGEKNALENVSFDVKRGEFVSVLGKNGSGKSTITKLVMGVIEADQGSMSLNGQDLSELSIFERSQKVGVVMQNPNHMISHHMIFDEVAFGLRNRGVEEKQVEAKVLEVLELCGLSKYRHYQLKLLATVRKNA